MPTREDNWTCAECQALNFGWRQACFSCHAPRGRGHAQANRRGGNYQPREGDWICADCRGVNFALRTACYLCHASRQYENMMEEESGDWQCTSCGFDNFSFRTVCRRCSAPHNTPQSTTNQRNPGYYGRGGRRDGMSGRQQQFGGHQGMQRGGQREGDWYCPECQFLNFSRRTECMQCLAPRPAF
ncbi:hypothetical protein BLNAU_4018 [Blattamonas nauphoetae]|uniref:RanBP2-type domain-containing protein n=1 Tax=Blattamonas nauphoetae TaxID=2049346 RepID=A0ABQ9YAY6_9EUKA|nr:hypothetical protein BLNAU_4018 [Blattamonas nauphoetae]